MSVITQGATRQYKIDNSYLNANQADRDAYIDLYEIRDGVSSYVTAQGLNATTESRKANFIINGIYIGDDDPDGNGVTIEGVLDDENATDREVWKGLAARVVHPLRFKRIYTRFTTARHIHFLGYSR